MGRKTTKKTSSGKTARKTKAKQIDKFVLTREEQLEVENLQLKSGAIDEKRAIVEEQKQAWGSKVQTKYGVDLQHFVINADTGECVRRQLKPVPPPAQEAKG